jgi:hypothetical protein
MHPAHLVGQALAHQAELGRAHENTQEPPRLGLVILHQQFLLFPVTSVSKLRELRYAPLLTFEQND